MSIAQAGDVAGMVSSLTSMVHELPDEAQMEQPVALPYYLSEK